MTLECDYIQTNKYLEYLDYNEIPEDWRPTEKKYNIFIERVGKQIPNSCTYWGFSKYQQLEEHQNMIHKRVKKDRITVKCGRKQVKVLSYIWLYGK